MRRYHHLGIPTLESRPGEVHLEHEIRGKKVIIQPDSPSPGVRVAFIEDDGAPVEFLQIDPVAAARQADEADAE